MIKIFNFLNHWGNMKSIYCLLLVITISLKVYSQYISNNPLGAYSEISVSEKIQTFGIGSYGFGSNVNYFNPHYLFENYRVDFSIFGNINLVAKKEFSYGTMTDSYINNKIRTIPGISINYKFNNYLLNLSYVNDFQFNSDLNNYNELRFHISNATYSIIPQNSHLRFSNRILQISLSRKLWKNYSAAIGLSTNIFYYNYTFDYLGNSETLKPHYDFNLESSGFSNYQFLFSFNHTDYNLVSWYILFKTQYSGLKLDPSEIELNNSLIYRHNAELYFPAHLAYGIQFNQIKDISISAEMFHENELEKTSNYDTKFSLGANWNCLPELNLGLIGSIYIVKSYALPMFIDGVTYNINGYWNRVQHAKHPYIFIFDVKYEMDFFYFALGYQFTKGSVLNDTEKLEDISGYLFFNIGYGFE